MQSRLHSVMEHAENNCGLAAITGKRLEVQSMSRRAASPGRVVEVKRPHAAAKFTAVPSPNQIRNCAHKSGGPFDQFGIHPPLVRPELRPGRSEDRADILGGSEGNAVGPGRHDPASSASRSARMSATVWSESRPSSA